MLILKIMLKEIKGSKTLNRQIKQVKIIIKDNVRENKVMHLWFEFFTVNQTHQSMYEMVLKIFNLTKPERKVRVSQVRV
jgi:hypothetical protein